jgi:uncharacterized membrane protein
MTISIHSNLSTNLKVVLAISETIREAGKIESGTLYAMLVGVVVDLPEYQACISSLIRTNLIKRQGHLFVWVGPSIDTQAAVVAYCQRIEMAVCDLSQAYRAESPEIGTPNQ